MKRRPRKSSQGSGTEYSATCGHTLVAGDMLVSCRGHSFRNCESRWHRGYEITEFGSVDLEAGEIIRIIRP